MSLEGKTIVITGATSGVGEAGAKALAHLGGRIIIVARNREKGDALIEALTAINPHQAHKVHYADLSKLAEMKRVGADIAAHEPRIDILINNAGAVYMKREETIDGLERTFATNHMAYFVITNALIDTLNSTGAARIISTASMAHRMGGPIDFDDLQSRKTYRTMTAYGRSKLANILFTQELARRFRDIDVIATSFHPGFVDSGFARNNGVFADIAMSAGRLFGLSISAEKGADTMVWLATCAENEMTNGAYYDRRKLGDLAAFAKDDAAAQRLWDESARIAS
ncbi:MAG: SDR family NAD(P)-dependent oxidoreductase [Caulobacterales bacterium]